MIAFAAGAILGTLLGGVLDAFLAWWSPI